MAHLGTWTFTIPSLPKRAYTTLKEIATEHDTSFRTVVMAGICALQLLRSGQSGQALTVEDLIEMARHMD